MTLKHARIVRANEARALPTAKAPDAARARRIAAEVLAAQAEAERIVEQAKRDAAELAANAEATARAEARGQEVARLAASFLVLRHGHEQRAERELDHTVQLASLLAERLMGEALRLEPARIAELAATALREVRGAREVRIEACPEDVQALASALGDLALVARIEPDPSLPRGSLVLHTDLGLVDARLTPELHRLAEALREALRGEPT